MQSDITSTIKISDLMPYPVAKIHEREPYTVIDLSEKGAKGYEVPEGREVPTFKVKSNWKNSYGLENHPDLGDMCKDKRKRGITDVQEGGQRGKGDQRGL